MITIKTSVLWSAAFTESFKKLMRYPEFGASAKLDLVRTRKRFIEIMNDVMEAAKLNDGSEVAASDLMESEVTIEAGKFVLTDSLAEYLTADDIFNLEPLLEEEP